MWAFGRELSYRPQRRSRHVQRTAHKTQPSGSGLTCPIKKTDACMDMQTLNFQTRQACPREQSDDDGLCIEA